MDDDAERLYELHDEMMQEARVYQDAAARALPGSARDKSRATITSASSGITQWPKIATS